MFNEKNSIGTTLIEMMLALILSIFILSSVFEIYLISENNRLAQTNLMNMQENAEIINQMLKKSIHTAGYIGCAKLTDDFPFKNHFPFKINQKNKIEFYRENEAKPGTDGIRIWHASLRSSVLVKTMRSNSIFYVTSTLPLQVNDNLLISDCKTIESFQIKSISSLSGGIKKIVSSVPISKRYEKNAEINKLEIISYFVGDTSRINDKGQPIYAFYSKTDGIKTELVENVDDMKLFFSTIEDNALVEYPAEDFPVLNEIVGVSFEFGLSNLRKKWDVYVSLF